MFYFDRLYGWPTRFISTELYVMSKTRGANHGAER